MRGKYLVAAACVLFVVGVARAQETTTGSISGQAVDSQSLTCSYAAALDYDPVTQTSSPY